MDRQLMIRQQRNEQKIKKQEELKIFRGRKGVQRSEKKDRKPKEDLNQKVDEEAEDYNRYVQP